MDSPILKAEGGNIQALKHVLGKKGQARSTRAGERQRKCTASLKWVKSPVRS